jgi:hypothetical protein
VIIEVMGSSSTAPVRDYCRYRRRLTKILAENRLAATNGNARGRFSGHGLLKILRCCNYAGDLPDVSNPGIAGSTGSRKNYRAIPAMLSVWR